MKKAILITLLLAGGVLLAGCVNPGDLSRIAPDPPAGTPTAPT